MRRRALDKIVCSVEELKTFPACLAICWDKLKGFTAQQHHLFRKGQAFLRLIIKVSLNTRQVFIFKVLKTKDFCKQIFFRKHFQIFP